MSPQPLYAFFDEAGDLGFGKDGSRHFLCGMLVTHDPWPIMHALNGLRERVFRDIFIPPAFHAAEDRADVRDRVLAAICKAGGFEAHITVIKKAAVPAKLTDASTFYAFVADFTLRWVLQRYPRDEPIFVVTDELPLTRKREALVKGFKASLASILPGRRYTIGHHASGSQGCLQAIDYVTWAVFRRLEEGDVKPYDVVKKYIVRESGVDWTLMK
jgi:hypothetical protein